MLYENIPKSCSPNKNYLYLFFYILQLKTYQSINSPTCLPAFLPFDLPTYIPSYTYLSLQFWISAKRLTRCPINLSPLSRIIILWHQILHTWLDHLFISDRTQKKKYYIEGEFTATVKVTARVSQVLSRLNPFPNLYKQSSKLSFTRLFADDGIVYREISLSKIVCNSLSP